MSQIVAKSVGLLLIKPQDGHIFVVRENTSKPKFGKEEGMLSIPIETHERKKDNSEFETLVRVRKEEMDGRLRYAYPTLLTRVEVTPGVECVLYRSWVSGPYYYFGDGFNNTHKDEVTPLGFMHPDDLFVAPHRREVDLVRDFIYAHKKSK